MVRAFEKNQSNETNAPLYTSASLIIENWYTVFFIMLENSFSFQNFLEPFLGSFLSII